MRKANIATALILAALLALAFCPRGEAGEAVAAATRIIPTKGIYEGLSNQERAEIMDLIYRYSYTVDARDLEGFVSLFTEDCRWVANLPKEAVVVESQTKLRAHVAARLKYFTDNDIQTRHLQTNTILTRVSEDRVHGTTYVTLLCQVKGESVPRVISTGIYKDEFVWTEDGWRFAVREATLDQERLPKVER